MISWRVWRYILSPPESSALYQRAFQQRGPSIAWYVGCVELLALLFVIPLILFMAPVYSLGWVIGITGDIARARENGMLDLLSLTPDGPLGARVAIALANLHREGMFTRANLPGTWTGRLLTVGLVAVVYLLLPQTRLESPNLAPFVAAVIGLTAMVPDHIQSTALAFLAAILGSEAAADRVTAQWSALVLLVAFQMGAYGTAIAVFFTLVPREPDNGLIIAAVASVGVLLVTREMLIVLLWRALTNRFGVSGCIRKWGQRG